MTVNDDRAHIYDLIVASASRPHLLLRTLTSLFAKVDVMPRRLIVHDDEVFPNRREMIEHVVVAAVLGAMREPVPYVLEHQSPPIRHGPALVWLLTQTDAEYVMYSQDDHEVVRPLPVARCLDVMRAHDLAHVRFNKRATLDYKDTWQGRWFKKEFRFALDSARLLGLSQVLTVADHWYFQTSLNRTATLRDLVSRARTRHGVAFEYRCEDKINAELDREIGWDVARDPDVRATHARTFIWGRIGDDRYVEHIGGAREDWARPRDRLDSER